MPSNRDNKLCYIAGGDYFQQEQLKKLLGGIEDCETETLAAEDFSEEFFFNFINTPSLFSENKAAVVKKTEKIKNAQGIIEKCADCVETNLFFLSGETKINKTLSKALKEAGFETVAEQKANRYDMRSRILQMFTDAGFKIDGTCAEELNEIFSGDLKQVANEIEKLSIYFAYKKPQSAADIMNAVTARKQDNIFAFIDAFTARRKTVCITLLDSFIKSGENLNILIALLFKRMREVYLYVNLRDQVKENRPWMLEKLKTGIRTWRREDLIKLYGLFAELDYKNKTGQISVENYLTVLVSKL